MIYTEIEYLWSDRCLFFGYGIVGGVLIILYERWGLDKTFFPKKKLAWISQPSPRKMNLPFNTKCWLLHWHDLPKKI